MENQQQTSTKKIVNEICDLSEISKRCCAIWNFNLISIVLFFTLHKAAKIRGRVALNRGQLIVVLSKNRRAWSRSMAQISEWKFVSDSDWWKEFFSTSAREHSALWIENWILLWSQNMGGESQGGNSSSLLPHLRLDQSTFASLFSSFHKNFFLSSLFRFLLKSKRKVL